MTTIQVGADGDLKEKADKLFVELKTDITSAIRIFLKQTIEYNGFPFKIKKSSKPNFMKNLTEDEFLAI